MIITAHYENKFQVYFEMKSRKQWVSRQLGAAGLNIR